MSGAGPITSSNTPTADSTLIVRHLPDTEPASFQIVRLRDGKVAEPVSPPSPFGYPVKGRSGTDLMRELQWYLESFLEYPFPPETDRADLILRTLKKWGEQTFEALFGQRTSGRMFDAATSDEYSRLHLQISSDNPRILAWPWEAMRDPELGPLAQTCQVERRLNKLRDAQPLSNSLPKDRVNILLVVARPYGEKDVLFRSIARPLIDLINTKKLAIYVEMLRPPTFDRLRNLLRETPGQFHILHFDGHGSYCSEEHTASSGYTLQSPEGTLMFETNEGGPDPISAEKLSTLLKETAVPAVILNACQSGMIGNNVEDPFASIATALLRSGIRSIVAMAYSLYVSGAQEFLPAFYGRLFENGSIAQAVRAGRQQMWTHPERVCVRGKFPLQDWLLPVLYEQDPITFPFAAQMVSTTSGARSQLPIEVLEGSSSYGFIGRDGAVLELERAMRRPPAGIVIQGLAGVGKSTLARGFVEWLNSTGGLGEGCFWFSFNEIRSAEYVVNRLGQALVGEEFLAERIASKLEFLTRILRERRFIVVWDNFEVVAGIPGTSVSATFSDSDRQLLASLLQKLRGGASKVLVTSRSKEDWIDPQHRFLLRLRGLNGEERWDFCEAVLQDLGITVNRDDEQLVDLMNFLNGHPLSMRVLLPRLESLRASDILAGLRSNLKILGIHEGDEMASVFATLQFNDNYLPKELRTLLPALGLFEGYIFLAHLKAMLSQVDPVADSELVGRLGDALSTAGVLSDKGNGSYEMHPALVPYLRFVSCKTTGETMRRWKEAFVIVLDTQATQVGLQSTYHHRVLGQLYAANFQNAITYATELGMVHQQLSLLQAVGIFERSNNNLGAAQSMFRRFGDIARQAKNATAEALTYYELGTIADARAEWAEAETCFAKALELSELVHNEQLLARAYSANASVAKKNRDYRRADGLERRAINILRHIGDREGMAHSYFNLGLRAGDEERWVRCRRALTTSLHLTADPELKAEIYFSLANVCLAEKDDKRANEWLVKSQEAAEPYQMDGLLARTYHQKGIILQRSNDLAAAREEYIAAASIKERLNLRYDCAKTYHQLGNVEFLLENYDAAVAWYRKSLTIKEDFNDAEGVASTFGQLGSVESRSGTYVDAMKLYIAGLKIAHAIRKDRLLSILLFNARSCYSFASESNQRLMDELWANANLGLGQL